MHHHGHALALHSHTWVGHLTIHMDGRHTVLRWTQLPVIRGIGHVGGRRPRRPHRHGGCTGAHRGGALHFRSTAVIRHSKRRIMGGCVRHHRKVQGASSMNGLAPHWLRPQWPGRENREIRCMAKGRLTDGATRHIHRLHLHIHIQVVCLNGKLSRRQFCGHGRAR